MISLRQLVLRTLMLVVGVAYIGANYFAAATAHPPLTLVLLGLAPLGAIALAAAWHSKFRVPALLLCAACALAIVMNLEILRSHVAWLYFIQHAGAMGLLSVTFGSTLGRGHADALCSRVVSLLLGPSVDADYLHFTWKVTVCWTIFFTVSAIVSVLLFFFGPIAEWSFFANVLTPIFLGAMFVGEYLIRIRVLPNRTHFKVTEIVKAYREYSHRQSSR